MLDYIYGGEPEVADKDLMELCFNCKSYTWLGMLTYHHASSIFKQTRNM